MSYSNLLEDYLSGSLPENQMLEVEDALKKDAGLRQELFQLQEVRAAIESYAFSEKKSQLAQWAREYDRRRRIGMAILTLVFIGLLLGLFYFLDNKEPETSSEPEAIFAQHFRNYEMHGVKRGDNNQKLVKIQRWYMEEQYTKLVDSLSGIHTEDMNLLMVKVVSHMRLDQFEEAHNLLIPLNEDDIYYGSTVKYYKALCLISLNKNELAVKILQDLSKTNSSFSEDASLVLKKMHK